MCAERGMLFFLRPKLPLNLVERKRHACLLAYLDEPPLDEVGAPDGHKDGGRLLVLSEAPLGGRLDDELRGQISSGPAQVLDAEDGGDAFAGLAFGEFGGGCKQVHARQ